MKNNFILLFIAGLLIMGSCSSKSKTIRKYNDFLKKEMSADSLALKKFILIIPNQGCGGCITVAEKFYQDFCGDERLSFIFTNVLSVKTLKYKVRINPRNTRIDKENKFSQCIPSKFRIYPCILYLRDGKVSALFYQRPEEAGFEIARQMINKDI